jgi:hypothetical protein
MQFFDILVLVRIFLQNLQHLAVALGTRGALRVSVNLKAHSMAHDVSKQTHIRDIFNGRGSRGSNLSLLPPYLTHLCLLSLFFLFYSSLT